VRHAPGFPCALSFEGKDFQSNLGRIAPRDRGTLSNRHCGRTRPP
jgi:hypothetical protein